MLLFLTLASSLTGLVGEMMGPYFFLFFFACSDAQNTHCNTYMRVPFFCYESTCLDRGIWRVLDDGGVGGMHGKS